MSQPEKSELDFDRIDHLDDRIYQLIQDFYKSEGTSEPITKQQYQQEVLLALHFAVAEHIANITCRHCRRKAVRFSKNELPRLISRAIAETVEKDTAGSSSDGSTHTH